MNISQSEETIIMDPVHKFHPHLHYILGDMIPPNQGSIISQDSFLNRTPRENCYILGYKGPNEISQDVPEREHIAISLVKILDPEGETMTRGSPYKFTMLNSLELSHRGKTIISPNW